MKRTTGSVAVLTADVVGSSRYSASKLKVAHTNVTKRLLAADWPYFEVATAFLRDLIERVTRIREPLDAWRR